MDGIFVKVGNYNVVLYLFLPVGTGRDANAAPS